MFPGNLNFQRASEEAGRVGRPVLSSGRGRDGGGLSCSCGAEDGARFLDLGSFVGEGDCTVTSGTSAVCCWLKRFVGNWPCAADGMPGV